MQAHQPDPRELLERLRKDPSGGVSRLLEEFGGIIHHQVFLFARGPDERGDLFQEVVLKLMEDGCRRLVSWREGRAAFSSYLFLITRRICRDYRKKIRNLEKRLIDLPPGDPRDEQHSSGFAPIDCSPSQRVQCALSEAVTQLERCFEILITKKAAKPKDRLLVLMRLEGYSAKEVGEFLGFKSESVDSRYSRIRRKLKECMKRNGFESLEDLVVEKNTPTLLPQ